MSLERVIEVARGELGYTEYPPGSNRTKYGEAFGWDGVPWCVIFLWWCFREAGESMAFFGGGKTASCGMLYRWYREQGQTVPAEEVREGDVLTRNFLPALRKADGKPGMYDTITWVLYTNVGTGEFGYTNTDGTIIDPVSGT